MPRIARLLTALAAALGLAAAAPAAGQSPEFFQVLNEANGTLKVLAPSITRGPVCAPMMVDQARQGLQANLFSSAANKVVIEPLEAGAKVALGAAGVPGAAISTYSAIRCGMSAADGRDLVRCLLGEAAGYRGGELLEALGVESLEGAVAGFAWDKAYGALRGAIEEYGATTESVEWSASGECSIEVFAQWNKRRQPGAEGGQVVVTARASNCRCRTANELRQGSIRFVVPVRLTPAGARQPGFTAGEPREFNLTVGCCASAVERTVGYLPGGTIAPPPGRDPPPAQPPRPPPKPPRTATGTGGAPPVAIPGGTTGGPRPPGSGSPATTPGGTSTPAGGSAAPPGVLWTVANPCPACQAIARRLRESQEEERRLAADLAKARTTLRRTIDELFDAKKRIAELGARLSALAGTGGSATDPESGITTSSFVQPDGTVKITKTGRDGRVIETTTRPYATAAKLREELAAQQARLAAAQAVEPGQVREVSRLDDALRTAERQSDSLRAELASCVERLCRGAAPDRDIGVVGGGTGTGGTDKDRRAGDKELGGKPIRDKRPAGKDPGLKQDGPPDKDRKVPPAKPPLQAQPEKPLPPLPAAPPASQCRPCDALRQRAQWDHDDLERAYEALSAARAAHRAASAEFYAYLARFSDAGGAPDARPSLEALHKSLLERDAGYREVHARFERTFDHSETAETSHFVALTASATSMNAFLDCLSRCTDLYPVVQTAISVLGNNPFDPRDPLGGRRTTGTPGGPPVPGQPGQLSFNLTAYQAGESGAVPITVQRLGGRTGAVSVRYATAGGTATEGSDYAAATGTLTWADGDDTPKLFSVAILADTQVEGPESFTVTLTGATGGAGVGPIATATVTIADDDSPPVPQPAGTIQFTQSEVNVTEGGAVVLTATRTGGSAGTVSVSYNTGGGAAQAGSDYSPVSGTLVWGPGDTSPRTVAIATIDDTAVEGPENFFANLSNPTGGAILGNPNVVSITIVDNDVAGPCGTSGHAWQANTGAAYSCSGSCSPSPTPQTVSVSGTTVTVSPFHAGGAATFNGCNASVNSDSSTLTYFGQAIHRATITRTGNNAYNAAITASTGATCSFTCSRSGP